jgi:hypothetical protein
LSATFGFLSAMGLLSFCMYPACDLVYVIPFLVLGKSLRSLGKLSVADHRLFCIGIGIDDMFIIYASFMKTDVESTTTERIANTFRKAGVSITITSLTDFVAFAVGILASFKSVQIFCVYAGKPFDSIRFGHLPLLQSAE